MQSRLEFLNTGLVLTNANSDNADCAVCTEQYTDPVKLEGCGHTFCRKCICQWLSMKSKNTCPSCRRVLFSLDDADRGPVTRTREQVVAMNDALLNSRLLTGEFLFFNENISWTVSDIQRATAAANFWLGVQHHANAAGPAMISSRRLGHHIIAMGNLILGYAQAVQREYSRTQIRDWCLVLYALYEILDTRDGTRMDALVMAHHLRSEIQVSLTRQGLFVPYFFDGDEPFARDFELLLQYICKNAVDEFCRHEQQRVAVPREGSLISKVGLWMQQYWGGR